MAQGVEAGPRLPTCGDESKKKHIRKQSKKGPSYRRVPGQFPGGMYGKVDILLDQICTITDEGGEVRTFGLGEGEKPSTSPSRPHCHGPKRGEEGRQGPRVVRQVKGGNVGQRRGNKAGGGGGDAGGRGKALRNGTPSKQGWIGNFTAIFGFQ